MVMVDVGGWCYRGCIHMLAKIVSLSSGYHYDDVL